MNRPFLPDGFSPRRTIFIFLLFALAFFLRFMLVSKGPFHYDTLDLAICAQQTLETHALHYEHGSGYPLTVIIGAFFIGIARLFGVTDPVAGVNMMSVVFGAAGVVAFFFFLEKLFDQHRALFGSILLAFFGAHIAISTFGKSLTLSIFFSLASAYFLLCYLKDNRRLCFYYAIAFLGFCGAARLSDLLVMTPFVYLLARYGRPKASRVFRDIFVFVGLSVAVSLIFYLPLLMENGFSQFQNVLSSTREARFLGLMSFVFPKSIVWLADAFRPEGVIVALAGLGFLFIHRRLKELVFFLIWFYVFQIFYGNISSSGTRYLVIAWLPLLAAQGYFLGSFRHRIAFYGAFILFAWLALAGFWRDVPAIEYRHRHALQVDFARWVADQTPTDSLIIAVDEAIFLKFYTDSNIVTRPVTCRAGELEAFFTETVDPVLSAGRRVFMVRSAIAYDECAVFRKTVRDLYRVKLIGIKINEDWHHALLNQSLFKEELYELSRKKERIL
jgi:hypothetical protein